MKSTAWIEINNQRALELSQAHADGPLYIQTIGSDGTIEKTESIPPGDLVMLINYYRHCRETGKEII